MRIIKLIFIIIGLLFKYIYQSIRDAIKLESILDRFDKLFKHGE